jgi:membrane-bound metal-dependent hydrolase YbcI (DUF457 family)
MFIGHYAVAAAGRGALPGRTATNPAPSLGAWFLAVQWLDLLWPILLLLGVERVRVVPAENPFLQLDFQHYPYTHSLLAALVWAALFAAVYRWRTGNGRGALWLGGGVLSHWVLDLVVHVPDLPLYPGGPRVGLGLWHSVPGTLALEGLMFVLAVAFYQRATRPLDRVGRWGWWALLASLLLAYAGNLAGPPPPSVPAIAVAGLLLWLLAPWAGWVDRHRTAR